MVFVLVLSGKLQSQTLEEKFNIPGNQGIQIKATWKCLLKLLRKPPPLRKAERCVGDTGERDEEL
jgi:hypothetical protein